MRNPHLDVLRRVTGQMTESRDLGQVLTSISNGLVTHAGMKQVLVYLYVRDVECEICRHRQPGPSPDDSGPALHQWATGTDPLTDVNFHRIPMGHYLVGRTAVRRTRIVVPDFSDVYRRYAADRNSVPVMGGDAGEDPLALTEMSQLGVMTSATFPLIVRDELVGVLGCFADRVLDEEEIEHLSIFANQAATAIKTAWLFAQVERANAALASENAYLRAEAQDEAGFGPIVGQSPALASVLRDARQVAATDSTVLILGETGTGKEVIARAIHDLSPRRERPLIKVNCGAIVGTLAESELFGHERGAFTGAVQRRLGRFELAEGGTLFMDEVGELSPDLQVKFLRVLQEREFERVGGHQPISVNLRVVAATNRDLTGDVQAGRFRADLYYRLNVFPIVVPPLRERREDIARLAHHFLGQMSKRLGKRFHGFSPDCLRQFERYDWPGNVRELHNVVERLCVLATGPVIDLIEPLRPIRQSPTPRLESLRTVERDHILYVLNETRWRIEGPQGAAAILGLAPSTLRARMNKLGIVRPT